MAVGNSGSSRNIESPMMDGLEIVRWVMRGKVEMVSRQAGWRNSTSTSSTLVTLSPIASSLGPSWITYSMLMVEISSLRSLKSLQALVDGLGVAGLEDMVGDGGGGELRDKGCNILELSSLGRLPETQVGQVEPCRGGEGAESRKQLALSTVAAFRPPQGGQAS